LKDPVIRGLGHFRVIPSVARNLTLQEQAYDSSGMVGFSEPTSSILFGAEFENLLEIGVPLVKRSPLCVRSAYARHDPDVHLRFWVPLDIC
jgi:hypothetical protein